MDDPDLIARVYPFDNFKFKSCAIQAIRDSALYIPSRLQEPQEDIHSGRDDREITNSPEDAAHESAVDDGDCVEIRFSRIPRTPYGVLFGCSDKCDVTFTSLRGLSRIQFSLTFDEKGRFIVKDLGSLLGTEVTYNGQGTGKRRVFQWIIGGDENVESKNQIIVNVHDRVQFQIIVAKHDLSSQEYMDKVEKYRQGSGTAEELLGDLDPKFRNDTERPTGMHTPQAEEIYLKRPLGEGQFGTVTHHWNVRNGEQFALKEPSQKELTKAKVADWLKEADTMSELSHDNIVKILGADREPRPRLRLEYIAGGRLDDYKNLTLKEIVSILRQILSALVYLHELGIGHRDIKPDNILVRNRSSAGIEVVLADFGLHGLGEVFETVCGTEFFAPPELWKPLINGVSLAEHSSAADIWSLGLLVYELLLGWPAYQRYWDRPQQSTVVPLSESSKFTWCEWLVHCLHEENRREPDALKQLLLSMLHLSWRERDTAAECLRKAMALPDTIAESDIVPTRQGTTDSGNATEHSTVRARRFYGEQSTGVRASPSTNVLPTTELSAPGKSPRSLRAQHRTSPRQSADKEAYENDDDLFDQFLQFSPSPSLHATSTSSKRPNTEVASSSKRPNTEVASQSRHTKRPGRGT